VLRVASFFLLRGLLHLVVLRPSRSALLPQRDSILSASTGVSGRLPPICSAVVQGFVLSLAATAFLLGFLGFSLFSDRPFVLVV